MHFTDYWLQAQEPLWQDHYVDYRILKDRLEIYGKRRRAWLRGDTEKVHRLSKDFQRSSDDDADDNGYVLEDHQQPELFDETDHLMANRLAAEEQTDFQYHLRQQVEKTNHWYQQQLNEWKQHQLSLIHI